MTILDDIAKYKREEVSAAKARLPLAELENAAHAAPPARGRRQERPAGAGRVVTRAPCFTASFGLTTIMSPSCSPAVINTCVPRSRPTFTGRIWMTLFSTTGTN